jgi:hypothetical protein
MHNILARRFEAIRPGNALMYYPEANVLVARHADPDSHTPAFKGVLVRVAPTDRETTEQEVSRRNP